MSRHVVVLGAGVSGKSLAKYFYRLGDHVTIVDRSLKALHNIPESHVKLLEGTQELPKQVDFVVRSPGIPPTHAWVIEAKSRGISVETDIQVALKSPEFQQYPSIGVTGSNGKTTTVSFLTHLFHTLGLSAVSMGNIGTPILELQGVSGIRVVEISSFQLVDQEERIPVFSSAALLNVCQNHLDYHDTMDAYMMAKSHIANYVQDPQTLWVGEGISLGKPYRAYFEETQEILDKASALKPIYLHDRSNYCAAYALAKEVCHVPLEGFLLAIQTFKKPPHRIEYLGKKHNVHYYNDSKATTVEAVKQALIALGSKVIVILGGRNKGGDFSALSFVLSQTAKHVIAMGECREEIVQAVAGVVPVCMAHKLEEAVEIAQALASAGDSILLSPGCTSFDQFQNFEKRGIFFKKLVGEMEALSSL